MKFKEWIANEGFLDRLKGAAAGAVKGWKQSSTSLPITTQPAANQTTAMRSTGSPLDAAIDAVRTNSQGYEREAALEVWAKFWDNGYGRPGTGDKEKVIELVGLFGMEPFYPKNFNDFPDGWWQASPGSEMVSGVVKAVLRPGLMAAGGGYDSHDGNHLVIPAIVRMA